MSELTAVVFRVDGRRFALPVSAVERVVQAVEVTPLAGVTPLVMGVIDVGGRIVPVLDIRRRFELPSRPVAVCDHLMIVDTGERTVALHIDEADALVTAESAAIGAAELAAGSRAPLCGVLQLADGLVWIQDVERLLSTEEAAAIDLATAAGAPC